VIVSVKLLQARCRRSFEEELLADQVRLGQSLIPGLHDSSMARHFFISNRFPL
jgi:hypothetical protein